LSCPADFMTIPPLLPALAFLGWDALELRREVPRLLAPLIAHLTKVQDHLHLEFPGLTLWRPPSGDLETIRFQADYRDLPLIQESLNILIEHTFTIDALGDPDCEFNRDGPRPPRDYLQAREELYARLGEDRGASQLTEWSREAFEEFNAATQRNLVQPLQEWALGQEDPLVRIVSMQLADAFALLHQMSPAMHEVQTSELKRCMSGRCPLPRDDLSAQYAQLAARVAELMRTLDKIRSRR
jgi:hypothetical protein